MPIWLLALGFLLVLGGIAFRGIRESMWVNVLCTIVEASGLVIVIAVGLSYWGSVDYLAMPATTTGNADAVFLVMQGAVLTFFAFIGFEDTFNVAEECRNPERTLPIGLILAMALAATLYMAIAITAVSVVPWQELAEAPGPITEVVNRAAPAIPPIVFTFITLFAVANTALVNYVTASRLIYGMSRQGLLHERLGDVHPERRTPHIAIAALLLHCSSVGALGRSAISPPRPCSFCLLVFAVVNGGAVRAQAAEGRGSVAISRFRAWCRRSASLSVWRSSWCESRPGIGGPRRSQADCCSAALGFTR